jgi:hypothetical protein
MTNTERNVTSEHVTLTEGLQCVYGTRNWILARNM